MDPAQRAARSHQNRFEQPVGLMPESIPPSARSIPPDERRHLRDQFRDVSESRRRVVREVRYPQRAGCDRRLPSLKHAVSILQLWCTVYFVHVDRLALNQLGSRRGIWPRKRRKRRRRRRAGRRRSSLLGRAVPLLRHIKARAWLSYREAIPPRLDVFSDATAYLPDLLGGLRNRIG